MVNKLVYVYLIFRRSSPKNQILLNMPVDSQRRKEVFRLVPEGSMVTRGWLKSHELSTHAIDNLLKSQQLEIVKNGVYKREGTKVEWGDIVYFLQSHYGTDLTIGGISALELQKLSHYLSMSNRRVTHLYGMDALPSWVNSVTDDTVFQKHSLGDLLGKHFAKESLVQLNQFTKIFNWKVTKEGLRISTPERAILEVLNEVPEKISFEHADELMQGLSTLSPRALQKLLELCNNVKVRRLFFWYAERQNHSWLPKINRNNIDLGAGNRVIVKGGRLNKKYKITVPEFYE
ncbi:MAG: type IV toxin-antitoxin system AbiEi family antitoxin domain-containing protein [Candidatus Saccharimonadaceae bacterium]